MDTGQPQKVTYDSTAPDDIVWGLGLGCAGVVIVILERVDADNPGPLKLLAECLRTRDAGGIKTVVSDNASQFMPLGARWLQFPGGRVVVSKQWTASEDEISATERIDENERTILVEERKTEFLLERIDPPIKLVIFGAGADAIPLVRLAAELGWLIEVFDNRAGYAQAERFPQADNVTLCDIQEAKHRIAIDARTVIVLMSHHYLNDKALLPVFLSSPARYVGILGPKKRTGKLLDELFDEGFHFDEIQRQRLYGPLGLDIGAEGPEQIAVAAIAEIISVLSQTSGRSMRNRDTPMHG